MTVFSYHKIQKRHLWSSWGNETQSFDLVAHLFWPLLFLLCGIIVTSLIIYVFLVTAKTSIAFDVQKSEQHVNAMLADNMGLTMTLGEETSPEALSAIANMRGLVQMHNPLYVVSGALAKR
ncbi:MAG: hypothetical protein KGI50_02700 [Patescibacteria group bacterium]|nr:hypothetical protein [Patescibacteria group bacterium]MDE2438578.1 hypothetical protein [Patescibacteria group bacterium]